jgi:hypothetical protein
VTIVSAGVHRTGSFGCVLEFILFQDGECIHIGADSNQFAAVAHLCDHAGLSHAALDSVSHLFQFIRNDLRRAMKLEADFWMHMEITPPFDQFL